jgi:hypothetical protein
VPRLPGVLRIATAAGALSADARLCVRTQYTETTELCEAAQGLGVTEAGARLTLGGKRMFEEEEEQEDRPHRVFWAQTEEFVRVPHAALALLLASRAAAPPEPLSEAEASERLAPMLRDAVDELDLTRKGIHGRQCAAAHKLVRDARATLANGAASPRAMPLADRIARMAAAAEELEATYEEQRHVDSSDDGGYDPLYDDSDGDSERMDDAALCLHMAAVKLEDALHAARGWAAEAEGRAPPTQRAALLALLRAAAEAGQDVLVYHQAG